MKNPYDTEVLAICACWNACRIVEDLGGGAERGSVVAKDQKLNPSRVTTLRVELKGSSRCRTPRHRSLAAPTADSTHCLGLYNREQRQSQSLVHTYIYRNTPRDIRAVCQVPELSYRREPDGGPVLYRRPTVTTAGVADIPHHQVTLTA